MRLDPAGGNGVSVSRDGQTLYVEHVSPSALYPDRPISLTALTLLAALLSLHGPIIIGLVVLAVPAFGLATWRLFMDWRRGGGLAGPMGAMFPVLAAALSAWLTASTLMVVIALIDATSWPALNIGYAAPVPFLVIIGSILSIHAGWRVWTSRKTIARIADPLQASIPTGAS